MDEFFRTLTAALVGAMVGGFIGELRVLMEGRRERRRALRLLLYQLLEVRYRVSTADPRAIPRVLKKYIEGRFGSDVARQLDSPQAKRQLRQFIQALAESVSRDPVAPAYQQAVDAIAPYDPILAYRLRDLGRLADLDAQIAQYYDRMMSIPEVAADPQAQGFLSNLEAETLEAGYSNALKNLSTQIRLIGCRIGILSSLRLRQVLSRQDRPSDTDLQSVMDRLLGKIVVNDDAT
jgi:hypothetical protein